MNDKVPTGYCLGEYYKPVEMQFKSKEAQKQFLKDIKKNGFSGKICVNIKSRSDLKVSFLLVSIFKKIGKTLEEADNYTTKYLNQKELNKSYREFSIDAKRNVYLFKKKNGKYCTYPILFNSDLKYIEKNMCKKILEAKAYDYKFLSRICNDSYYYKIKNEKTKESLENLRLIAQKIEEQVLKNNEIKKETLLNAEDQLYYFFNSITSSKYKNDYSNLRHLYCFLKEYYFEKERTDFKEKLPKILEEKEIEIEEEIVVTKEDEKQIVMNDIFTKTDIEKQRLEEIEEENHNIRIKEDLENTTDLSHLFNNNQKEEIRKAYYSIFENGEEIEYQITEDEIPLFEEHFDQNINFKKR